MAIPDSQIAQYIRQAGATDAQVPTMVAIALAESGGNPDSIGDVGLENSTWGPSVGLWQIRSLRSQHGTGGVRDEAANHNPATNAVHAMSILQGSGLAAWSTYTSQKYRLFLPRGQAAAGASPSTTDVTDASLITNPFGPLSKIFSTLSNPGIWTRIAIVLTGSIAIYVGATMLVKNSSAYETAQGVATTVAKVVK